MILKLRTIAVPQAGGPAGELSPIPARHPWRVMAAVLLTLLFLFFNRPASGAELSDSHIRRSIGKHVISETAATQDQVDIKVNKGIVVKPRLQRDNKDIASDMDRRLAADLYVDDANIEVTVKDGRANLQGTVGTAAENRRAADNAWVNGVVSVDERQLMVVWGKNDHMRRASPHIRQSDQTILKAVKDALLMDPRVNAANPDVSVVNGAVTLSGVVETLYAKKGDFE